MLVPAPGNLLWGWWQRHHWGYCLLSCLVFFPRALCWGPVLRGRRTLGGGCWWPVLAQKLQAVAQLSQLGTNVKVHPYRASTSPLEGPHEVLIQLEASMAPAVPPDLTPAASRGAPSPGSPPLEARDSLKVILAKPMLQVVAKDSLSQLNAIFTRRYPEITGSPERAHCCFSFPRSPEDPPRSWIEPRVTFQ